MSLEIVTYANKSAGMFEELVNNEHGVKVKFLVWVRNGMVLVINLLDYWNT